MKTPQIIRLKLLIFLMLITAAGWFSALAVADEGVGLQVLGADGTLTKLVDGPFGELFPEGSTVDADADSQVLALVQIGPDGGLFRWLVPGTEDSDVEKAAGLLLDDQSGAAFLLWETAINGLHPLLRLVRFDGETFSSSLDITSGAFADKGTAQLMITREAENLRPAQTEVDGEEEQDLEMGATVVHVVWWQQLAGDSLKLYTPVFIENGQLSQQAMIFDLSHFTSVGGEGVEEEDEAESEVASELKDLLAIRRGATGQTVVFGFLEPATSRLRTVRMDVVPTELSNLGDKLGPQIVIIGMRTGNRQAMADGVWPLVTELGNGLHESVQAYMAIRLEDLVMISEEDPTPESLAALTEDLRNEILKVTAGVEAGGLARSESELVDVVPQLGEGTRHVLEVRVMSDRPAPLIGSPDGDVHFFLSSSGYHAMVVWKEDGRVFFRETEGDASWGEIGSVAISEGLGASVIFQMLEQRIASR
jgi:hypothetical protein